MNSSRKSGREILGIVSKKKAERLILECANLPIDVIDPDFPRNFIDGPIPPRIMPLIDLFRPITDSRMPSGGSWINYAILAFRRYLRSAWDASDQWQRDWHIFRMRQSFLSTTHQQAVINAGQRPLSAQELFELQDVPPAPTPIDAVMYQFRRNESRLRHCPGDPCPAPYFFATKRGQRYCSEACALPAQREAKRLWWAANRGKQSGKGK